MVGQISCALGAAALVFTFLFGVREANNGSVRHDDLDHFVPAHTTIMPGGQETGAY